MDNLLTVAFEAHNPEKNHHRRYQVTIGRDLLDDWTVCILFGRTGQAGQALRFAGPSPDELQTIIRERLRRRLSAPRRIGCSYQLTAIRSAPDFHSSDWLPQDLIAQFLDCTPELHAPQSPNSANHSSDRNSSAPAGGVGSVCPAPPGVKIDDLVELPDLENKVPSTRRTCGF